MSKPKWAVRKRNGAWQAFDEFDRVMYASEHWESAVMYALIGSERTISEDYERTMNAIRGIARSLFRNYE